MYGITRGHWLKTPPGNIIDHVRIVSIWYSLPTMCLIPLFNHPSLIPIFRSPRQTPILVPQNGRCSALSEWNWSKFQDYLRLIRKLGWVLLNLSWSFAFDHLQTSNRFTELFIQHCILLEADYDRDSREMPKQWNDEMLCFLINDQWPLYTHVS